MSKNNFGKLFLHINVHVESIAIHLKNTKNKLLKSSFIKKKQKTMFRISFKKQNKKITFSVQNDKICVTIDFWFLFLRLQKLENMTSETFKIFWKTYQISFLVCCFFFKVEHSWVFQENNWENEKHENKNIFNIDD